MRRNLPEFLEHRIAIVRRYSRPGIGHLTFSEILAHSQTDTHFPLIRRELQGVAAQIGQYTLNQFPIAAAASPPPKTRSI